MRAPVPAVAAEQWRALAEVLAATEAPCRNDPDAWFSDSYHERRIAAAACALCPARLHAACAAYAVAAAETYGVWAGVDRQARHGRTREAVA